MVKHYQNIKLRMNKISFLKWCAQRGLKIWGMWVVLGFFPKKKALNSKIVHFNRGLYVRIAEECFPVFWLRFATFIGSRKRILRKDEHRSRQTNIFPLSPVGVHISFNSASWYFFFKKHRTNNLMFNFGFSWEQ